MIVVNSSTRQFNIPGADLVFGVESDSGSERKNFQCPRYVGNNLDIAGGFVRINYRNANGEIDEYLVEDVAVNGDNVTFSWELTPKVTMYKGNISFVMCVVGPDTKVKWHTTLGRGQVLEGLEPDSAIVEEGTADVVAQLIAMVEAQTAAVEAEGSKQIKAVQTAAKTAESDAVAEIEAKGVNTRNSIPADYTALSEAVDSLTRGRACAIVCSAEGSAVVVNDASDLPMQGLRIFGRSTQDGTPTPDAPVEIKSVENPVVTVASQQLIDTPYYTVSQEKNGITFTVNEDGSLRVIGTATSNASFYFASATPIYKGHYFLSGCPAGGSMSGYSLRLNLIIDGKEVSGVTDVGTGAKVSIESENISMKLYFVVLTGTTVDLTVRPMLNVGDSAKPYCLAKPKQNLTFSDNIRFAGLPITSGGNYTDSDGQQWICDEVDLVRGVYTQRILHERPTLTKINIDYENTEAYSIKFSQKVKGGGTKVGLCSVTDVWVYGLSDNVHYYYDSDSTIGRIHVPKGTDITGVDFVAILATPIETPLSEPEIAAYRAMHSNHPNTTVLNDSGAHMVVKYAADTKLYIDNKITALIGG